MKTAAREQLSILDIFKTNVSSKKLSRRDKNRIKKENRKLAKLELKKNADERLNTRSGIKKYVRSVLEGDKLVPDDVVINDSSFPLADNVFQFFTDPRFSTSFVPVAKQIEVAINIFTDYCPKCSDTSYAQNIPTRDKIRHIKKRIVFLVHGKCPKCNITRARIWKLGLLKRYTETALLVGQRGFKSSTTAMLIAYLLHRLLKLQDPPRVYGLPSSSALTITFTALTFAQAKTIAYREFYNFIKLSPWFTAYHQMLSEREAELGVELFRFSDTLFHYRHRNLLGAVQAPDQRSLRGATRVAAVIDEIGWFTFNKEHAVKVNANETYTSLSNSLATIKGASRRLHKRGYYDVPAPLFANISSPSNIRDKICSLVQESKKESSEIFARHYSTFEFNPFLTPYDLRAQKEEDYVKYKRDYLAQPPLASNPFIEKRRILKACIDPELPNMVEFTPEVVETGSGVYLLSGNYEIDKSHPYYNAPKIMCLDAGFSNNSFACSLICAEELDNGDYAIVVPAMFECIPEKGVPVDHSDLYTQVLKPLALEANVKFVYADRWNSIKMLQDFVHDSEDEIDAFQYSVSFTDFQMFKAKMMKGNVIYPSMELSSKEAFKVSTKRYPHCMQPYPVSHFYVQTLGANVVMEKKVDKGDRLTDDLLRTVALGYAAVNLNNNLQELLSKRAGNLKRKTAIGIMKSVGQSFLTTSAGAGGSSRMSNGSPVISSSYGTPLGFR
jgi:hypothetical protein